MSSSGGTVAVAVGAVAAGMSIGALIVLFKRQADLVERLATTHAAAALQAPSQQVERLQRQQQIVDMAMGPGASLPMPVSIGRTIGQAETAASVASAAADRTADSASDIAFDPIVPSMEDLVRIREEAHAAEMLRTPQDVLSDLARGNARFWTGQSRRPELNAMERRAEIWQVYPKVAILGCSDSRVPPEIIFDQGLGDLFVIRVAGNAYGTGVAGSIHYAVTHLHVKVVMVLGHEGCGVVRTAQRGLGEIDDEPVELRTWLQTIRRGVAFETGIIQKIVDSRARDREAVIQNVRRQVRRISRKPVISDRLARGDLAVVGAFYEKRSGMVDFIRVDDIATTDDEDELQGGVARNRCTESDPAT